MFVFDQGHVSSCLIAANVMMKVLTLETSEVVVRCLLEWIMVWASFSLSGSEILLAGAMARANSRRRIQLNGLYFLSWGLELGKAWRVGGWDCFGCLN